MRHRIFKVAVLSSVLCALVSCGVDKGATTTDQINEVADSQQNQAVQPPNIVLIMTDDQGYGDVNINQNPVIDTPHLSELAQQSVRFTSFHVDPTCSPTRAALMTGKHSMRAGVWHTVMGRSFLAKSHVTIAEALSKGGYETAVFGKWHLGDNYPFRPQDQGFKTSVIHGGGGVGQSGDYWGNTQFDDLYFRNGKPEFFEGYATTTWFDEALTFIREKSSAGTPFFAYIATNAPHSPFRADDEDIQVYRDKGMTETMSRFYAMVTEVDKGVGRIRSELADLGIADNTIFIFMTDNGSSLTLERSENTPESFEQLAGEYQSQYGDDEWVYNAGMRGYKASVYEGGHRVPFYIHYPNGGIGEPRDIDTVAAHFDIMPTLLDFTQLSDNAPADLDGISLHPLLTENQTLPARSIVVTNQRVDQPRIGRPAVVIEENWRFVSELDQGTEELYNLATDPGQTTNLLTELPEKTEEMREKLQAWWQRVSKDVGPRARPIVGSEYENPSRLNANDWMEAQSTNDIAWYPGFKTLFLNESAKGWLGNHTNFKSLPWHVEVAENAEYEISLYFHDIPAQQPVNRDIAILELDGKQYQVTLDEGVAGALFTLPLEKGPLRIKGWFANAQNDEASQIPAFYAYIEKI